MNNGDVTTRQPYFSHCEVSSTFIFIPSLESEVQPFMGYTQPIHAASCVMQNYPRVDIFLLLHSMSKVVSRMVFETKAQMKDAAHVRLWQTTRMNT
jgi:hypothetical protein